ncbi:hypothetical protein L1887_31669 [Cichorium endivia]|nr:hypothetical protein L1887_31669 [Cichorium endivia]
MAPCSTNFVSFTCLIFLPSIIILLINHCDGSPSSWNQFPNQCNGTMAECSMLVEEHEEFVMDRGIMAQMSTSNKLTIIGQKPNNPACAATFDLSYCLLIAQAFVYDVDGGVGFLNVVCPLVH